MENHLVILSTPKRRIPKVGIKSFVETLINERLTKLEYFGDPIDNQADYIDEEMQRKMDSTSYIEIFFESENNIDYGNFDYNDFNDLIFHHLNKSKNLEFVVDKKNKTIYI